MNKRNQGAGLGFLCGNEPIALTIYEKDVQCTQRRGDKDEFIKFKYSNR